MELVCERIFPHASYSYSATLNAEYGNLVDLAGGIGWRRLGIIILFVIIYSSILIKKVRSF